MNKGHTHRSFVSYIDKSRTFYRAHGYEQPYRWAHHRDVPFQRLSKPLADCRIGVVTTADKGGREAPRSTKLFAAPHTDASGLFAEKSWDREATHINDPETYLPLTRLGECAARGRIAAVSPRFYGIPTDYSQRRTTEEDAPRIESWLHEDAVDAVLLIAI